MKNLLIRFLKSSKLFELIMIFAGITLSMQFNNWNEERKLKQLELELISDLYIDVVQDSIELHNGLLNHEKYFIKPLQFLDSCLSSEEPIDYLKLKDPLRILLGGSYMSKNNGAYECFKYEGISTIKNSRLKIKLFDYYESGLNWLKVNQNEQNGFGDEHVIPLFIKYTNAKLEVPYESYLKMRDDKEAKLVISFWIRTYIQSKDMHRELIPLVRDLKHEMEKELLANGKDPKQILKIAEVAKS
jgi:hypothetical protein